MRWELHLFELTGFIRGIVNRAKKMTVTTHTTNISCQADRINLHLVEIVSAGTSSLYLLLHEYLLSSHTNPFNSVGTSFFVLIKGPPCYCF